MRITALVLGFVGIIGAAQADDRYYDSLHQYDSSDYAAQVFYRASFGGMQGMHFQNTYGFQAYNERTYRLGAPAILRADYIPTENIRLSLNGIDFRSFLLISQQNQGGIFGSFGNLTTAQSVAYVVIGAIGLTSLTLFVDSATEDEDVATTAGGTGGTGGS